VGVRSLSRRDPAVASIIRAWRELTDHLPPSRPRRTLIACSGGADSCALALALASSTSPDLIIAHIVHDLRPRAEADADRDAAAALAAALSAPFVEAAIKVKVGRGNVEARARRERYAALRTLALSHGCPFVATAHHADDQLETMLMALLRGAGPRGLRGIARVRRLGRPAEPTIQIIRPMLGTIDGRARAVGHAECERICQRAGWVWREDQTNRDISLLRNALRIDVIPKLKRLRPRAAEQAVAAAAIQHELAALAGREADAIAKLSSEHGTGWAREALRDHSPVVIGEALTSSIMRATNGRARDHLGHRTLGPIVRAIRDHSTEPRRFILSGGVVVEVTAHHIHILAPSSTVNSFPCPNSSPLQLSPRTRP